ncbi:putative dsRNA-binding protein [Dysosmobacter sp. Sow4_B12]|uniref:putative dsRNA-binding protein n=1 Tax=Dysosmobacter sp. Sow4_B12 TaxID=3438777 RepID=UPI003F8FAD38
MRFDTLVEFLIDFECQNGNPIWKSVCHIAEESKSFSAKSSSKKDAKKSAAFKMLQYVLKN